MYNELIRFDWAMKRLLRDKSNYVVLEGFLSTLLGENLRLDFSIVNDMNYYSGIIFRGYLPGLASGVLAGGRYDNLLKKMGRKGGAIGFAVYLDQFQRLFPQQQGYAADVLLLYDDSCPPSAVADAANAILSSGRTVRVEREIPGALRFREVRDLGKGV